MNSFYVELDYLDLMSVSGSDSEKFLQGQLTCDVEAVSRETSCLAAVCDNKGRVIANFRLSRLDDDTEESYFLEMQPGLLDLLKPALEKYGVFYKSTIANASSKFQRFGLTGPKSQTLLSTLFPTLPESPNQVVSIDAAHLIKISDTPARFELWLDTAKSLDKFKLLEQELQQASRSDWELLDIRNGVYSIEIEDSSLFTPQILNYDLTGLISFSKGCYTGQEIVARMHYRGKAKKRLSYLVIESDQEIKAKETIQRDDNTEVGQIIKIVKTGKNNYEALAILKTETEKNNAFENLRFKNHLNAQIEVRKLAYLDG